MSPSILKVRLYGDPCLVKKSQPLTSIGVSERMLIKAMFETMHDHKGIGLAAPQVGINKRLLICDIGDGPMVMINPKVVEESEDLAEMEEGCLSIPGVLVNIVRPMKIRVQYVDENNQPQDKKFEDLLARVILHETDHLNGKLIVDYVPEKEKAKLIGQFKKALEEKHG